MVHRTRIAYLLTGIVYPQSCIVKDEFNEHPADTEVVTSRAQGGRNTVK